MESSVESLELDYIYAQEQDVDDLIPTDTKQSTGIDVSPHAESPNGLSRRPTQILDQRSPLPRLTSSAAKVRNFSHPLTRQKTASDALVDFDGPDDPYRPLNWPSRKKVTTVLLYGLTTTCSSWATSMYSNAINPCVFAG